MSVQLSGLESANVPWPASLTEGARKLESHLLPLCCFICQLADISLVHTHQDVLRLDVSMDDLTLGV